MTELIDVNLNDMKKHSKNLDNKVDQLQKKINDLYSNYLYKVGDKWNDKSSYEYINKLTDYLQDMKNLANSVDDYVICLETATDAYRNVRRETTKKASVI